jgi:transposase-like protein
VARDNTVKYRWHTLQLLPGSGRPGYVGAQVEVQVRLDGSFVVFHQGKIIPTREAPPRPGTLRAYGGIGDTSPAYLPKSLTENFVCETTVPIFRTRKFLTTSDRPGHKPTLKQQARWEAVQAAKRKGMGIRETARELGISRNTVKRNLLADGPIVCPPRLTQPSTTPPEPWPRRKRLTESLVINT